ncbi:TPA: hypothetical protein DDW35_12085, partial [Candidatus Sumerlaeota bacterium]|nr:hypothetical protein [Candidatus Sumerlaeota bacterium]
ADLLQVVAVKGDVKDAEGDVPALFFLEEIAQTLGKGNAVGADAYENEFFGGGGYFHNLFAYLADTAGDASGVEQLLGCVHRRHRGFQEGSSIRQSSGMGRKRAICWRRILFTRVHFIPF